MQKNTWGFVALVLADGGDEEIVGYTIWSYAAECAGGTAVYADGTPKRDVAVPEVKGNNAGLWFAVERLRSAIEEWYNEHPLSPYHIQCGEKVPLTSLLPEWLRPAAKSGEGERMGSSSVEANARFVKAAPAPPLAPLPVHFHCSGLGVSPDCQNRGVGRALMLHALETLVEPHDVPATLIASPEGFPLYKSTGFKIVGWLSPPGLFRGGMAMIWDGPGGRKWIKPADGAIVWEREVDVVHVDGKEVDEIVMEVPTTKDEVVELMVDVVV